MGIAKTNFTLQQCRQDCDLSADGPLNDTVLLARAGPYSGSFDAPIAMSNLAGSIACIQPITGSWGARGGTRKNAYRDYTNSQYMNSYSTGSTGPGMVNVGHQVMRGAYPATATITRHFGYLPASGRYRVEYKATRSGGRVYHEIITSSSGYLSGSNTYVDTGGAYDFVKDFDINGYSRFLSIMLQCNINSTSNQETGRIYYENLKVTLL